MPQRIYLIGMGAISHHHAAALAALPGKPELYAADPNPVSRAKFLESFPAAKVYDSSDAMLAHAPAAERDIVCVATPPLHHYSETLKALRSGRNVLCEKPFAMNASQAEEMVGEADQRGLAIGCCSNRFIGWELTRRAVELIACGKLGEIYLAEFIHREPCTRSGIEYQSGSLWFLDKSKCGGGPLMDWGPYDFAVLTRLFDPVEVTVLDAVCAHPDIPTHLPAGVTYDIETHAAATLLFRTKAGAVIPIRYERAAAFHGPAFKSERIFGTAGSLTWDWLPYTQNPRLQITRTLGPDRAEEEVTVPGENADPSAWMHAPMVEFDRYLRKEPGAQVMVNRDALRPFLLIQAIYDCAASRQSVRLCF